MNEEKSGKSALILVAEDDKFLSKVYLKKLDKEGYEVVHATNGEEAVKLAREKNPDLVLMDLIMPIKDGFEALTELKADEKTKNIKVVVLSNLSQDEDRKRVMDLGAVEYAVKANINFSEVLEIIKKHLK
jgi:CheY-like chemotaxis protein